MKVLLLKKEQILEVELLYHTKFLYFEYFYNSGVDSHLGILKEWEFD